jgi:hypothetical protein
MLFGMVTAGLVLSHAAYEPLDGFQAQTGLPNVQYLYDNRTDTHVRKEADLCASEMDNYTCAADLQGAIAEAFVRAALLWP